MISVPIFLGFMAALTLGLSMMTLILRSQLKKTP
jgi:hypothetical protein